MINIWIIWIQDYFRDSHWARHPYSLAQHDPEPEKENDKQRGYELDDPLDQTLAWISKQIDCELEIDPAHDSNEGHEIAAGNYVELKHIHYKYIGSARH